MIDKHTGHITLNDSFELTPSTRFCSLSKLNLGEVQEIRDMNNGWKWLDIKNLKWKNNYFILSLCFYEEELSELSILVKDKPFNVNDNWESWSKQKEQKKLNQYKKWLTEEIGEDRVFEWGNTWIEFDSKDGSTSIGIRYEKK